MHSTVVSVGTALWSRWSIVS